MHSSYLLPLLALLPCLTFSSPIPVNNERQLPSSDGAPQSADLLLAGIESEVADLQNSGQTQAFTSPGGTTDISTSNGNGAPGTSVVGGGGQQKSAAHGANGQNGANGQGSVIDTGSGIKAAVPAVPPAAPAVPAAQDVQTVGNGKGAAQAFKTAGNGKIAAVPAAGQNGAPGTGTTKGQVQTSGNGKAKAVEDGNQIQSSQGGGSDGTGPGTTNSATDGQDGQDGEGNEDAINSVLQGSD
ncbi:MAG: hypothetical protein Q9191_007766 [Dirinaria sp. TL-2023a]